MVDAKGDTGACDEESRLKAERRRVGGLLSPVATDSKLRPYLASLCWKLAKALCRRAAMVVGLVSPGAEGEEDGEEEE